MEGQTAPQLKTGLQKYKIANQNNFPELPVMKILGEKKVKIFPTDPESHKAFTETFSKLGVEFYTYGKKEDQLVRATLKGMPTGLNAEEISFYLKEVQAAPSKVVQFKDKANKHIPVFGVSFPAGTNRLDILNIKILDTYKVNWSFPKKKKSDSPKQCYNCRGFNHLAKYCGKTPRCVQCGSSHKKKCTAETPNCANCDGPHPADSKDCEIFKKVEKAAKHRATKPQVSSAPPPPTKSANSHNAWTTQTNRESTKMH